MKIALVTGTRRDTRQGVITKALDEWDPELVIVGDATGVDAEARAWAMTKGKRLLVSPAPWEARGKAAGPFRNETLVIVLWLIAHANEGKGSSMDYEVGAFAVPDGQSIGTFNTVRLLNEYNLPNTVTVL